MALDPINILLQFFSAFAVVIFVPVLAMMALLSALIGLRFGVGRFLHYFWHMDGTTNEFAKKHQWWDQISYKKWKGYNRLHSYKWNAEHTA